MNKRKEPQWPTFLVVGLIMVCSFIAESIAPHDFERYLAIFLLLALLSTCLDVLSTIN